MTYFKKAFGQNLKLLRKAKNLTQEQLAELVNLNQRQLTRIENGISFVSSDVIERLIVALNIDVKTLFDFQLEKEILCQTGTDNTPYYKVIDNNKVVVIEEYQSKIDKNKLEEKVIKVFLFVINHIAVNTLNARNGIAFVISEAFPSSAVKVFGSGEGFEILSVKVVVLSHILV